MNEETTNQGTEADTAQGGVDQSGAETNVENNTSEGAGVDTAAGGDAGTSDPESQA